MHPIKKYCKAHNILIRDFAESVGRAAGYISQVIMGVRNPSAKLCLKIEEVTDGEIKGHDLIFWNLKNAA
jgi:DNA-binding transcriptional regulator YdaS (Cro superfamily)